MGVGKVHKWSASILVPGLACAASATSAQAQGVLALVPATSTSQSGGVPATANGLENLLISLPGQAGTGNDIAIGTFLDGIFMGTAKATPANARDFIEKPARLPEPEFGVTLKRISSTAVEFASPDQRLTGRMNFASGSELFRPGQHMLANSLTSQNSWRHEVDVSLSAPDPDAIGFTLTAGAYSARLPMLGGPDIRHGVGEMTDWMESRSWELGAKITLPDSGIRYSGGISWSQFSLVGATRFDRQDWLLSPRPRWRTGRSQWHKLDAELWKNADGEASAYAFYGTMDADYRSYLSQSETPLIFDGKTFELGGEVRQGGTRFTFSSSSTAGDELSLSETTARLKTGPFDLKLVNGSTTVRDITLLGRWDKDSYWKGDARLSLKSLFGASFGSVLLPKEASIKVEHLTSTSSDSVTQSPMERTKLGFGLSWSGKRSMAEFRLSRVITSRPASVSGGPSREERLAVDFNGFLSGNGWDLSYYGSIGDQDGPYSSNSNLSGGVDFSLSGKNRPKLSFGVDFNRFDLRNSQYGFRDRSFSVNAKLDLSQYLPRTPTGQKPYLIIKAYGDWSKSRITGEREDNRLDPTLMVTFGTKF